MRLSFGLLLTSVLVGACAGHHGFSPSARFGVAPDTEEAGPFRLVYAGPKGDVEKPSSIVLAFSKAADKKLSPARVLENGTEAKGEWTWFGDRTAIWKPTGDFKKASTYRVEPAIEGALPFEIKTPRPALKDVHYDFEDDPKDQYVITAYSDIALTKDVITKGIRIEGKLANGKREAISFTADTDENKTTHRLIVDPKIFRYEDVEVIASELKSEEGPLVGPTKRFKVEGIGPLTAKLFYEPYSGDATELKNGTKMTVDEGRLVLRFSKSVKTADVLRLLSLKGQKPSKEFLESHADDLEELPLEDLYKFEPSKKYRMVLAAGLSSKDKDRLSSEQVFEVETASRPAETYWLDIGRDQIVESARTSVPIRVRSTNVKDVQIVRAPIDDAKAFELLFMPEGERKKTDGAAWLRALPGSKTDKLAPNSALDSSAVSTITQSPFKGMLGVALEGQGATQGVSTLMMTNLGVTSTWSPHGALVWVTRLSDASAVAGAKIFIHRPAVPDIEIGTTDANGIARIPGDKIPREQPAAFIVTSGDGDRTIEVLPELDRRGLQAIGDIFVDRPLYRPGEPLWVKGYVRLGDAKGFAIPAGKVGTVELVDRNDRVITTREVTADAFGAFDAELTIPKSTPLGRSTIRLQFGERLPEKTRYWRRSAYTASARFLIDEFRSTEIEVKAKVDKSEYLPGETPQLSATVAYLAGPPASGAPVTVSYKLAPTTYRPDRLRDYSADATQTDLRGKDNKEGYWGEGHQGKTGKGGGFNAPLPLDPTPRLYPRMLSVEVDSEDVSKVFTMTDSTSAIVHPADTYLGLRVTNLSTAALGESVQIEGLASSIDNKPRAVKATVEVFREPNQGGGAGALIPVTNLGCTLAIVDVPVRCALKPTEEGRYFFRARGVDSKNRPIAAATSFLVVKPSKEPPPKPQPIPKEPAAPAKTFEEECRSAPFKNSYVEPLSKKREETIAGEPFTLCLRGTQKSRGLFLLEREGVLHDELVSLDTIGQVIERKTDETFAPNIYASLRQITGRTSPLPDLKKGRADRGAPSAAGRTIEIGVKSGLKPLDVEVSTANEYRPGDEATLTVKVREPGGKPAPSQVTIWAVDKGIISLVNYGAEPKAPDPTEIFAEDRNLTMSDLDSRDRIFSEKSIFGGSHRTKAPSVRMGATSVGDRSLIGRSIFKPVAFYFPNVITDANGNATVKAKLPDNLTTWQVFAVATTASGARFGKTETTFKTNKTMMVRPAFPRFLRTGDRFEATAVINAANADAKLSATTSGVLSGGLTSTSVHVDGAAVVRFPVEAKAVGRGKITVHGEAGGLRDDVTLEEVVQPVLSMETRVFGGTVKEHVDEPLGDLSRGRPDIGGLDWRVSTTPLVGLAESMRDLVDYPYGCTEQLSSRLIPLMRLRSLAKELGATLPPDVDAKVRSALLDLASHQHADGGFGFWATSKKTEPALTVLALSALYAAKETGFSVPPTAMERGIEWLKKTEPKDVDLGSQALVEHLFATTGQPRVDRLRALANEPKLPLFGRALVAHSLAKADPALAARLLSAMTSGGASTYSDEPDLVSRTTLSSNTRTTAMVLRALVAIDPKSPMVPKVVQGLLSLRRDGRWTTTQASAWALTALDEARPLVAPRAAPSQADISFDERRVETLRFTGAAAGEVKAGSIPIAKLLAAPGANLGFTSNAPLQWEATLRYSRREPPLTTSNHGIHIARRYQKIGKDGELTLQESFNVGDYVAAEVFLATDVARDLVVLDDPIPAGFEAVNTTFANADDRKLIADPAWGYVTHRELRDDRVVSFMDEFPSGAVMMRYPLRVTAAGRFVVPPARVECMYAPEIWGRTGTTWVDTR